jgi:peptidoglycan/LPS O-acetylase OafA/YrhL
VAKTDRLIALDVGRAIAIIGVIAVHLYPWIPGLPYWLSLPAKSGEYGVQLFFVISAFTICKSLSDDRKKGIETAALVQRFYLKRFARIVPLYYVGIVFYGLIDLIATKTVHSGVLSVHSSWDILANVLFVHSLVPTAINSVVPGGWSIGVEMAFYVVAPALFAMSGKPQGLWITAVAALFICYGADLMALYLTDQSSVIHGSFFYYWPPTQFPCFVLGIVMWRCWKPVVNGERQRRRIAIFAWLGMAFGYPALLVSGVGLNMSPGIAPFIAAVTAASLLLLLLSAHQTSATVSFLQKIGERSYGVYIWHFVGIFILRIIFKHSIALSIIPPTYSFVFGMALVLAFAYKVAGYSEQFIEKPFSRWTNEKLLGSAISSNRASPVGRRETPEKAS